MQEGDISRRGLPGRGDRHYMFLLCLGMAELPHGVIAAHPIATFLSQRLICEHTLGIPCFHSRLTTMGKGSTAID